MTLGDFKRCLQKNLTLKRLQEALLRKGDSVCVCLLTVPVKAQNHT